jgi:hypothetical protein
VDLADQFHRVHRLLRATPFVPQQYELQVAEAQNIVAAFLLRHKTQPIDRKHQSSTICSCHHPNEIRRDVVACFHRQHKNRIRLCSKHDFFSKRIEMNFETIQSFK